MKICENGRNKNWFIHNLPFYWGPLKEPNNSHGLPNNLPFELGVCEKTGRVLQVPSKKVLSSLEKVYSIGSMITGMMDEVGTGRAYADDFLSFIVNTIGLHHLKNKKILEIGCGTGYLLKQLKDKGAKCIGIEPGEHGIKGGVKNEVEIIHDYYPSNKIDGHFDIILHYNVLEHIVDPVRFLRSLSNNLTKEGHMILSVPDGDASIDYGDISMLFHEHFSYFSSGSLYNTLFFSGVKNIKIEKSGFGGALYASGQIGKNNVDSIKDSVLNEVQRYDSYKAKAVQTAKNISEYIKNIKKKGKTLGIYVPARLINAILMEDIDLSNCRFFDDNPMLHGTYYPGINIMVEQKEDLINKPTDHVLISSCTFGDKIFESIRYLLPNFTKINLLNDIYNHSNNVEYIL